MLGARARAAEYNAFKAASARQASREAEEQAQPPAPAPVSLSAFTKPTQITRNKGPKAWIPLVLDATPEKEKVTEKERANVDDRHGPVPVGTKQAPHGTIISASRPAPSPSTSQDPLPLGSEGGRSLSVPGSLRNVTADSPPAVSIPTPQRFQAHVAVEHDPPRTTFPSARSLLDSPQLMSPAPAAAVKTTPSFGTYMTPSDLSPTKQENKLARMAQEYTNLGTPARGVAPAVADGSRADQPSMFRQVSSRHFASPTPQWTPNERGDMPGLETHPGGEFDQNGWLGQQAGKPPYSDLSAPAPGTPYANAGKLPSHAYADGECGPPQHLTNDYYDRNTSMQRFMAEQQSLAKSVKTVLRNPDLCRVRQDELPGSTSPPIPTSSVAPEVSWDLDSVRRTKSPSCVRPPPGFERQFEGDTGRISFPPSAPRRWTDRDLQREFDVGTDAWFDLKPVTNDERLKMNKAMRRCHRRQAVPEHILDALPQHDFARPSRLETSLREISAASRSPQGAFDALATEHLANHSPKGVPPREETASSQMTDAEVDCAKIKAVGQVVAQLADDQRCGGGSQDVACQSAEGFHTYKPAPEYAIERPRMLKKGSSSASFFEEETSGFYTAPSRIARDPRFRPPSKDGCKAKPEEEWTHRHDSYGRRRLEGSTPRSSSHHGLNLM